MADKAATAVTIGDEAEFAAVVAPVAEEVLAVPEVAQPVAATKKARPELTAEQTGQSVETILEDNARDKWFTAQEALDYGFIDHIAERSTAVSGGGGMQA